MKKTNRCIDFKDKFRLHNLLSVFFVILTSYSFAQAKSSFNEMITLDTENQPLAKVLEDVSQVTGYELVIDENWDDLPITVKFEAIPLEQALKRILAKVNYAIIYSSDRKVLIRIYERDSTVSKHTGTSARNRNPHMPIYPREIDNSGSLNSLSSPDSDVQDESEESDRVSQQQEVAEEESKNKENENKDEEDENESSDEDSDAENQK
jgi:type II secretory pathway component GspD/PulD (secretin)